MLALEHYQLHAAAQLLTPCLLVYPELIRANLAEMIRIAGTVERLRPHVKTHKTPEIVRLAMELGVNKHKCATLSEATMLAQCGAPDVLIAYPQVGPAIDRLIKIVDEFPRTQFSTVIDNPVSFRQLESAFKAHRGVLGIFLDLDTGMQRTGIRVGRPAVELYLQIHHSEIVHARGLHVYDGQNHQSDLKERRVAVSSLMQPILHMVAELNSQRVAVPVLVCGGTPTFPVFAEWDYPDSATQIEASPGTCVLSDFNYGRDYSEMTGIHHAAVLLTRVVSRQHKHRLTVDLGYKAVASDPPAGRRCHFLNLPDAIEIQHSEEHLVIESAAADSIQVGDVLYALPAHVCPTVALHSHLHVVENGQVVDRWQVQARNRLY